MSGALVRRLSDVKGVQSTTKKHKSATRCRQRRACAGCSRYGGHHGKATAIIFISKTRISPTFYLNAYITHLTVWALYPTHYWWLTLSQLARAVPGGKYGGRSQKRFAGDLRQRIFLYIVVLYIFGKVEMWLQWHEEILILQSGRKFNTFKSWNFAHVKTSTSPSVRQNILIVIYHTVIFLVYRIDLCEVGCPH